MRILILGIILLFCIKIEAQEHLLKGEVTQSDSGEPLAFANIAFAQSKRGTITNEEGNFLWSLSTEEMTDTLIVSHLGFRSFSIPVVKALSMDELQIELELIGVNLPVVVIGDINVNKILEEGLDRLDDNYYRKDHVLRGFYKEEVKLHDGRHLNYGEGLVEVFKKGYKDHPRMKQAYYLRTRDEFVVLKKGFFEEFTEVELQDDAGTTYPIPRITQGVALPKLIDFLKSEMSPLIKEQIEHYKFSSQSMTYTDDEEAFVVGYEHEKEGNGYIGTITINSEDHAFLQVTANATDGIKASFNRAYPHIELLERNFVVEYKKHNEHYAMSKATVKNIFYFISTGDTLYNDMVFTTTERITENLPRYDYREKMIDDAPMIYGIPDDRDYWQNESTILRSSQMAKVIRDRRAISRETTVEEKRIIDVRPENYKSLKQLAAATNKLIFVDIYTDWCPPCKKMERTTFANQEVVNLMNKHFLFQKVNLDNQRNHDVVKELKVRSIPTYAIVLPSGEIIDHFGGYRHAPEFTDRLSYITENIDLTAINRIREQHIEDEDKMQTLVHRALFQQMQGDEYGISNTHLVKFIGNEEDWRSEEAFRYIFYDLVGDPESDYSKYFLKLHKVFKLYFPEDEVDKKIYELGVSTAIKEKKAEEKFNEFAQDYLQDSIEYYRLKFGVDYCLITNNQPAYCDAVLHLYESYPSPDWAEARVTILDMMLMYDSVDELHRLWAILESYTDNSVDYEWMDLQSVYLYKTGQEQEAYALIPKLTRLALDQGVRYRSSLHFVGKE